MFLGSLVSSFKESVVSTSCKYRISSFDYDVNDVSVNCELVGTDSLIRLNLNEIITSDKLQFFCTKDVLLLTNAFNHQQKSNVPSVNNEKKYYTVITIAFTILLLSSNLAEAKICNFFGYAIGAGTLIFPLLYVLNDVLTEVYGFSASRKTILIALCVNCLFSLFIYGVILLPSSEHWDGQNAFEQTFAISPRIVFASVISYFIGELLNATILAFLKIKLHGKYFAFRAIFSTLVGSLIESTMFAYIAFFGRIPVNDLIEMVVLLTLIKVVYEILIMPITIKTVSLLKEREGISVFEKPSLKSLIPSFFQPNSM